MTAPRIKPLEYAALVNGYESEINRLDDGRLDFEDGLLEAHKFVDLVRRSNALPYAKKLRGNGTVGWYEADSVLLKYRHVPSKLSDEFLSRFELSPQIQAFTQIAAMLRLPRHPWRALELSRGTHGKTCAEVFNTTVDLIRQRANSPGFNKQVVTRRAAALADCQSASDLVRAVSSRTRHILAIRLDLAYRESVRAQITPGELKSDLRKLLNNWRKHQLHKFLKAYVWKLQYGCISGYYVHLVILFDAWHMDLSVDPLRWIAELWNSITAEKGAVHPTNSQTPIFCGGAGLWQNKQRDRQMLLQGIYYLLQKDQYFRVKVRSNSRIFGKSELR